MSKVAGPAPATDESEMVNVAFVAPLSPSATATSLMLRFGSVTVPWAVSEKSSTARPSSAPEAFKSFQRIQKVAPLEMARLGTLELIDVRFAARLPLRRPTLPAVIGELKSSESTSIHKPVVSDVAFVLY